jgi:deazaflavin-dependent oxidoreductase (nitroreductase family)
VPSDLTLKAMNAVHRAAQWLSMGKLGWTAMKMPVVELTTVGRKSGKPRTVLLTSPLQMGSTHVVVASRGGDDKPPAWLGNLVANPDVEVAFAGRTKVHARARVATPAERAQWWPRVVADHAFYGDYQKATTREIALVVLEPVV